MHTALTILGAKSVKRWTAFLWSDVKLLRSLARVFKRVICPNSNQQASVLFPNVVQDPPSWQEEPTPKVTYSRKKKPAECDEVEDESKKVGAVIDLSSSKPIIFSLVSSSDEEDNDDDDSAAGSTPKVSDLKTCRTYSIFYIIVSNCFV